jgi:hypothetical protein
VAPTSNPTAAPTAARTTAAPTAARTETYPTPGPGQSATERCAIYITASFCANGAPINKTFYDQPGEHDFNDRTGSYEVRCLPRAQVYYTFCGGAANVTSVRATFVNTGVSRTYP